MSDKTDQKSMREWRRNILVSTWLAYAGLYFCRKPFYVAKATLIDQLGFTVNELGEVGTAYLVAYAIGQFTSAWLGQVRGARALLLIGMGTSVLCNVAFGFTNTYWPLFTFMALNGLAQATGWPAVVGTLGRWTRRSERGTVMGLWGTCYQLGGVAASMWAAFWLAKTGIRGAFLMASLVLFGCWIAVALWQRNGPEDVGLPPLEEDGSGHETEGGPSPWTHTLVTNLLLIGVFYFGIKFIRYAIWSWTPFLLETNFGLAVDEAGYLSTVFDLAGFAGVVFAGIVSDRYFQGARVPPSFLMVLGVVGGCAALHFLGSSSLLVFGICLGLIGFMLYGPDSLLAGAGAIEVGSPRVAVATAGIINGMGSIGAVVQELVVSNLLDGDAGNTGPIFAVLWGASLLSITALSIILLRNRQAQNKL